LDAPIAAPAQEHALRGEERRPDRDATLGEPRPRFLERDFEHLVIGHRQRSLSDVPGRAASASSDRARRARLTSPPAAPGCESGTCPSDWIRRLLDLAAFAAR
jgi:hypothetical protein